jgi:hypothetical protein
MKTAEQPQLPVDGGPTDMVPAASAVLMFERLATNPAVDVEKLERLIGMQERIMRHNAQAAFNTAFARMQPQIPEIDERGQILVKGQLRSTFAKLEDIHKVIKPILATHGFAIRHRTEWPSDRNGVIRIVGILSHDQGHSEESTFEAPMDRSEYRTDIQSMGSTVSYGRRYTTIDLLNIATRGADDDGKKSGAPQTPDGYDDWMLKLSTAANAGLPALETAFQQGDKKLREYLTQHDAITLAKMRTRARTGKAANS